MILALELACGLLGLLVGADLAIRGASAIGYRFGLTPLVVGLTILAIVADRDPGIGGSWIDSFSHETGVFSLRLIQTEGGPAVTIHRLPLARLEREGLAALDTVTPILSGQVTD